MYYDSKYTVKNGNLAKKGSKMKNMKFSLFSGILALLDAQTLDIWLNFNSFYTNPGKGCFEDKKQERKIKK